VWLPSHKTVIPRAAQGVTSQRKSLIFKTFNVSLCHQLSMAVGLLDPVALTQP
jgi:hypothetical protein